MKHDDDFNAELAEMERMDRFFDGEEMGDRPLEVLRLRGIDIASDDAQLDDAALHAKLWEIIEGMAAIGMVLDRSDHLTDRQLYRYLVSEALVEETILPGVPSGTWHVDPLGGCSEKDIEDHLRYYADDQERAQWLRDYGEPLPPKEPLRADRDRHLPTAEMSRATREPMEDVV
jgi:hypothetical protein